MIVSLVSWLCFWDSPGSTAAVSCNTCLAGVAASSPRLLAMLCSTSASLPGSCCLLPDQFLSLPVSQIAIWLHSGSAKHAPLPSCLHVAPTTFLPPLRSKGMDHDLEGGSYGRKKENLKQMILLKNLLSESLHSLLRELKGKSFP